MPPQVALFCCLGLICWLFHQDLQRRQFESPALWIPFLWLLIAGSRPVGYWLGSVGAGESDVEGNFANLLVQGSLIGAAVIVLFRRQTDWNIFVSNNKALLIMYLFFALSMMWAEHPFVVLKRDFKDFGSVMIVLVLLMQKDPLAAVRIVYVRCAYILLPLSIICIKYFPSIGRRAARNGDSTFTGLTIQKNLLGETVLAFGIILILEVLLLYREHDKAAEKRAKFIGIGLLLSGLWLLVKCDSKTSLICLTVGGLVLWLGPWLARLRLPRLALAGAVCVLGCCFLLDNTLDISGTLVSGLGRNKTLTGRSDIWHLVMEKHTNPIIGCGFYSFWDSEMGKEIGDEFMVINEAHNGYLEEYIDGGIIGVALFAVMLFQFGRKAIGGLLTGTLYGSLAFSVYVIALLYNISESNFFRLGPLWFTLLLVSISPQPWGHAIEQGVEASPSETESRRLAVQAG